MKIKPEIVAFIATFILVNGFLSGWLPLPLTVSYNIVDVYKPKAYTLSNDVFDTCVSSISRVGVDTIAIQYWYHWSYDGYEQRDDWEPVIVYIRNGEIVAIAHRVHYQWRLKTTGIISDNNRVIIVFAPLWHTPLNTYPINGYIEANYTCNIGDTPEDINPSEIYGGAQLWLKNVLLSLSFATIIALITHIVLTIRRVF